MRIYFKYKQRVLQSFEKFMTTVLAKCHCFAGHDWAPIHTHSDNHLWSHSVCHDWFWLDHDQVLLVYLFHVLHLLILHFLRNDGRGCLSKPQHCCHNFLCLLCNMEPFLRIYCSTNSKFNHSYLLPFVVIKTRHKD